MLLTVQQKYILEVLRKLHFIRRRQLAVLLGKKFQHPDSEISEVRLDAMLRQLRAGNSGVFLDGDLVRLSGARPDALCLEALDVMLELAEGVPEDFTTRVERPGILRFSWGTISACLLWRNCPRRSDPRWNCWLRKSALSGSRVPAHPARRALSRRAWLCQPDISLPPAWRTAPIGFMAPTGHEI